MTNNNLLEEYHVGKYAERLKLAATHHLEVSGMDVPYYDKVMARRPFDLLLHPSDLLKLIAAFEARGAELQQYRKAAQYPEKLPCAVLLEPGYRFGKGVSTQSMLNALRRASVHVSDMAALSSEEKAEVLGRIEEFKKLFPQPVPDGWVMVPAKANIAMIRAGGQAARKYLKEYGGNSPQVIYQAMLAAALKAVNSK